jgi:hypothetical protein
VWHWQQAIGWIGFGLSDPPVGFNIFYQPLPQEWAKHKRDRERERRRSMAARALAELVTAVKNGKIKPIWRGSLDKYPSLSWPASQARMIEQLDTKLSLDNSAFQNLHFRRAEILFIWPHAAPG